MLQNAQVQIFNSFVVRFLTDNLYVLIVKYTDFHYNIYMIV